MRILHIVGSISPETGGPAEAIRMLIRYAPPGFESEVATLDAPSAPFITTLPFPVHALGTDRNVWHSPALTRWLRENRDRFDGFIVHGLWEYTGLAVRRTIAGHKPYLVFPHGMLDPYFKRAFPLKHFKKWLYWLLAEFWVLRSAHRVLFTSQLESDLARQTFAISFWRPLVVSLGAAPPPHDPTLSIPAFFERCPDVQGHRFLLYLSRIHRKKGCDMLLEAFRYLRDLDPDLHLVMAGPDTGNWRAKLQAFTQRARIDSRVHWPGMLLDEAKWGAFAASEAFVLPSHQENFGIAVVESLACGRPVLITNQINIAPDIAENGCGFVEPDTLDGTKALLQRWMLLSDLDRATMTRCAMHTFRDHYDMRKNTERILRVFERDPNTAPSPFPEGN